MKQLVIGLGEIGSAIQKILNCEGYDIKIVTLLEDLYDVLHICFPYFDGFEDAVLKYKETYKANLIIVHSTVPIGTCEKIGAVSSPCRGVHPHLEKGIRTFVKFFGGEDADNAAKIFSDLGIETYIVADSRSVEAFKLWDTTIYGFNIILEKEINRFCKDNGLDFYTVYTSANESYNIGYRQLGMEQFQKYVLGHKEGKIGGHCVIPNCDLLESWVAELIKEKNGEN